jgi:PBP1b-binding outer membrane lipoprotein LpoB
MRTISILILLVMFVGGCSPHTTPAKHKRYHNQKQQGPDFPLEAGLQRDKC